MASLAITCNAEGFSKEELKAFYSKVARRKVNKEADTWVFENIVMALHNVSALDQMSGDLENKIPIVRSAIVAWYYAVYYASSAMVAAASGSKQETHAATAKVWQRDIVNNKLVISPFNLSVDTLIEKQVKKDIESLRNGNDFQLVNTPNNQDEAWGALCGYVSGTADYEKWRTEERVRTSKDFKALNVENFRTKEARELRDSKLESGFVNFLIQAFRYRGKANYRDSIYLSYGENREETISNFVQDLRSVATSYLAMACYYSARRVEKGTWECFAKDIKENLVFPIDSEIYDI